MEEEAYLASEDKMKPNLLQTREAKPSFAEIGPE